MAGRDYALSVAKKHPRGSPSNLLHGFHFLSESGVMATIHLHGLLFRGSTEERIRTKLLKDGYIETVIGLPANLFFSTGIPSTSWC